MRFPDTVGNGTQTGHSAIETWRRHYTAQHLCGERPSRESQHSLQTEDRMLQLFVQKIEGYLKVER